MILLDTHALVWLVDDNPRLGPTARAAIAAAWQGDGVATSAISFWECAMLCVAGRLELPAPTAVWRIDLLARGLLELPVDGATGIRAAELQGLHKDPADRLILATAAVHGATLVTADERLLSGMQGVQVLDARK